MSEGWSLGCWEEVNNGNSYQIKLSEGFWVDFGWFNWLM